LAEGIQTTPFAESDADFTAPYISADSLRMKSDYQTIDYDEFDISGFDFTSWGTGVDYAVEESNIDELLRVIAVPKDAADHYYPAKSI
jgi:hypothetical protein